VIKGTIRVEPGQYALELSLTDLASGRVEARWSRMVHGDLAPLIAALQVALDELLPPAAAPVARPPDLLIRAEPLPRVAPENHWLPYAAYTGGTAGVLAAAAGGVFGVLARVKPMGSTREEAQSDLRQRESYARTANTLFLTAGVLVAASLITAIVLARESHPPE
jgi:hypothetical protein